MKLLVSQKNQILEIINESFSSNNFLYKEVENNTIIEFKNSKYYFKFEGNFMADYSPGRESVREFHNNGDWSTELHSFRSWLNYLSREIEQTDRWAEILKEESFFNTSYKDSNDENIRFNFQEIKQIEESINKLKEGLKNLVLSSEIQEKIINKLDYLCEKSKILGKIDWKNIAVGTLISIASQISMQYPKIIVDAFIALVKVSFKVILLLN